MMRRFLLYVLLITLVVAAAPAALASGAYGKYLPPDQAFELNARNAANAVVLDWRIADGYYLYRKKFNIVATHGVIGKPRFPAGEVENDPNFGRVEIYRREVRVAVPYKNVPSNGRLALTVTYQGCAEDGLCYPPITKHLSVSVSQDAAAVGAAAVAGDSGGPGGGPGDGVSSSPQSNQGRLASLVEHANPFWFVSVFFVLGILLSFTPCVLPMVPILAGVLGKNRVGGARRGFFLSLVYVLAMAAVYTSAGIAAGFIGTGLQGFFQAPWIIALFSATFVALALSLFGVYQFSLPRAVTNRLTAVSGRADGASWYGAAAMGGLAALIVSPCIAAPIAGALVVIGQAGEPARGGMALAALSLGMGAPLIVYGTVVGRLLPKTGAWMIAVERLLGIAMLVYAVWLLSRILPAPVVLVLWGVIGLLAAVLLGVLKRPVFSRQRVLSRSGGVLSAVAGLVLIVGGAVGGTNPLAPFAGLRSAPQAQTVALTYRPVQSVSALETQLRQARTAGRPVMVDFRADWCTSCLEMEHTTLQQPAVRQALAGVTLLRVDVTKNTTADRQLLKHFGLYGPPAYIFYDRCGQRLNAQEVVGYVDPEEFLPHVHAALDAMPGHTAGCQTEPVTT